MHEDQRATTHRQAVLLDNNRFYWSAQAVLLAPTAVLWAAVAVYYARHSSVLLTLIFSNPYLTLLTAIGFPLAAAVLSTLHLLTGRMKNEVDWSLGIGIIFLVICSVAIVLRQMA
jgi:uncharacterized membrane protein YGL010W